MYDILFAAAVEKDFKRIDRQYRHRIIEKIELLGGDPRPRGSRKLVDTISSYRIRIGDCRVVYQVDDDTRVVTVMHVRHRKDVYG